MADDELQLIAPPAYFLALAGVAVPAGGGMVKVHAARPRRRLRLLRVYAAGSFWSVREMVAAAVR
jgi:hypothetical protein